MVKKYGKYSILFATIFIIALLVLCALVDTSDPKAAAMEMGLYLIIAGVFFIPLLIQVLGYLFDSIICFFLAGTIYLGLLIIILWLGDIYPLILLYNLLQIILVGLVILAKDPEESE